MNVCRQCNQPTANPSFCCKSCAAIYNNKKYPKRQPIKRFCKHCDIELPTHKDGKRCRTTVCSDCNRNYTDWSVVTLADVRARAGYQVNTRVRGIARTIYENSDRPKQCTVCNYDKHYEVAHIKSIASFSPDTSVAEVNHLDNLVALCRNCHWELDNNLLTL